MEDSAPTVCAQADHKLQAALIRAVRPGRGAMAVGLEAVQRKFQPALDAYVAARPRPPIIVVYPLP